MVAGVGVVGAAGGGSGANVGKIAAQIIALQKQSNALMKRARGLLKEMRDMPEGDARKAIQKQCNELSRQIKLIQAQIAQLQQEAAKAGESNSIGSAIDGVKAVAKVSRAGSSNTGSGRSVGGHVDTTA
jgi:hypothetical protein